MKASQRGHRIRWRRLALGLAFGATAVAVVVQPGALGAPERQRGGTFRIALSPLGGLDNIDPALSYTQPGWALLDTTCARLMAYPDKPPPAAFRVAPEVAAGFPKVSKDFTKYTFTLRRGFRFSDGTHVRASAFARAINRALAPAMKSPGILYMRDIVGAVDVMRGKTTSARGVVANGNTLTVEFTRPAPDFAARTTLPFFCAVPPNLPADPEGVGAFPGAGPYYVHRFRPGDEVIIRRNRFYGGTRPHHVDGFHVNLLVSSPDDMIRRIDRGEADWGHNVAAVFLDHPLRLVEKYGVDRSRFFLEPGLTLSLFAFNSSRPLFKDNARLRRAVNFALDRQALQNVGGGPLSGGLTDQYLPPTVPGFSDADLYPLESASLEQARELADGNLRSGRAVLYTSNFPIPVAVAQLAKQQLAEIGLQVQVKAVPDHIATATYLQRLGRRAEPWDLAFVLWTPNLPDPYAYINVLLDRRFAGSTNITGFAAAAYDRQMRSAARLTKATERNRAYGELDVRLARDAAPLAAIRTLNEATFVSNRVGCIVLRPVLDLTAVCLK